MFKVCLNYKTAEVYIHVSRKMLGKLLSPHKRQQVVTRVREQLEVSERQACQVLEQVT